MIGGAAVGYAYGIDGMEIEDDKGVWLPLVLIFFLPPLAIVLALMFIFQDLAKRSK
jgi:hypothetical protein